MNRSLYFNYIEDKLNTLAYKIEARGKLNILDYHIHSENFYLNFFNKLFGWGLTNLNASQQNVAAIDLIDHTKKNKIIVQVSSTCTKQKIESALKKDDIKKHSTYSFKFISISKDASELRNQTFSNPHKITFVPATDIYDIPSLLKTILPLPIETQKSLYEFIKAELGSEIDLVKLDSNLATIINILSLEDLSAIAPDNEVNKFEIERKIEFNELDATKITINDYSVHYTRLDGKYKEFDTQGSNKSFSVLQSIRTLYVEECAKSKGKSSDYVFLQIIENTKAKILTSANYVPIPIDELDLCVNILVVDAFIRCKIFKNPANYNHVTS